MPEERSFQLLEVANEPALNRSPNYLRLLQAYRSYVEHGSSAQECALRLTEITHPGLRRFHLPQPLPPEQEQVVERESGRLNAVVLEMVQALNSGDRIGLARQFQEAEGCFNQLSRLAQRGS
jgi:hypothetical protein